MIKDKLVATAKQPLIITIAIAIVYLVYSLKIPFFSDMSYISSVANQLYNSNFSNIINPINDNGTPPLYSLYLSLIWKFFGYKLWISHLAVFPFFIGLILQFHKLAKKYLSSTSTLFALLILILDPIFISQFLLMGYDIILVFLFLLAINSIINHNYKLLIIGTLFIPLINIRGFSILLTIFIIQQFIDKPISIGKVLKSLLYYTPSLVIAILWYIYHYSQTDWFAVSPQNSSLHHIDSFVWTIKNSIFELFAFISNGRFIIVLFIGIMLISNPKYFFNAKSKELLVLLALSIIPFIIIFTTLQYPTGPRYFMISYPFLYLLFIYKLAVYNIRTQKWILLITLITLSISNFWTNPYPYSNAWDSSLKVTSYFKIQKEMLEDMKAEKIEGENVIANFPLHKNMKYNYLDNNMDFIFSENNIDNASSGTYIIYSNIYNNLELRKETPTYKNLKLYKEYYYYPAWIKLYIKE